MSASRVKTVGQSFSIRTSSWSSNELTITTATNHLLYANTPVQIPTTMGTISAPANVLSANTFKITCDRLNQAPIEYVVPGFVTGQTGGQAKQSIQRGMSTQCVIQSFVTGTGGAQYNIDLSLDGDHWIQVGNVTHTTANNDTGYFVISPGWTYFRPNVVSIGANTLLSLIVGN